MSAIQEHFDELVAHWHESPRCGEETRDGSPCRRVASWRVSLHGHSQTLMCTQHLTRGLRWVIDSFEGTGGVRCKICGRCDFTSADDVALAVRL